MDVKVQIKDPRQTARRQNQYSQAAGLGAVERRSLSPQVHSLGEEQTQHYDYQVDDTARTFVCTWLGAGGKGGNPSVAGLAADGTSPGAGQKAKRPGNATALQGHWMLLLQLSYWNRKLFAHKVDTMVTPCHWLIYTDVFTSSFLPGKHYQLSMVTITRILKGFLLKLFEQRFNGAELTAD